MRSSREKPELSLRLDPFHGRSQSLSFAPSPSWVVSSTPSPVTTSARARGYRPRKRTRRVWESPIVIVLGVLVGLMLASMFFRSRGLHPTTWSPKNTRLSSRSSLIGQRLPLPSLDHRRRILDLVSTLSPHHTAECTRGSQPRYVEQVTSRYEPLKAWRGSGWGAQGSWSGWLGGKEETREDRIKNHLAGNEHKYFFALNLFNSFDVIPDIFATIFRVSAILGYDNVYFSIYENGSKDQTKALLKLFDAVGTAAGLRMNIRTSSRVRGAFNHRIEYLAEVRNAALVPLYEMRDATGEVFDSIIFMNDILPCVDDLLELIWQSRRQNAGITCASDYMFHDEMGMPVLYDNWVARDMNGTAFRNAPFESVVVDAEGANRFLSHLPFQVQACWNGAVVMDSKPFYQSPRVQFRMGDLAQGECSASECSLIANDYAHKGFGRIIIVPRVKLAYDNQVFRIIHPPRRNLTEIRGYARLGGLPDNPRTDPQDNRWYGPHDRLFLEEEYEDIDFQPLPPYVWCHGWDGAGDIDEPDMEPIWEATSPESQSRYAIEVHGNRGF